MGCVRDAVPFTRSRIQMRPGLRSGSSVSVALPFSRSHAMLPRLVDAIKIIALAWAMYKIFGNLAIEIRSITERSEEHTSELQSLMRISYAVFCLKKKHKQQHISQ